MSPNDKSWDRLVAAARKAPKAGDEAAPFGFSTRVAAKAFEPRTAPFSAFARLSLRAAGVACILACAAVAANYSAIRSAFDDEAPAPSAPAADDPVAEVVDLGS
jgi:hypothetical protein